MAVATESLSSVLPEHLAGFEEACEAVLGYLRGQFGHDLWMVTRVEGDDWVVLSTVGEGYPLEPGAVLSWPDSMCYEMIAGNGPRYAPDTAAVPAYRDTPIYAQYPIRSYIGFPLTTAEGEVFGTLCAFDPAPTGSGEAPDLELIELCSKLLSSLLSRELEVNRLSRELDRVLVESMQDPLTGLRNRRGWDEAVQQEEARTRRLGSPAAVLAIDLDNLKAVNDRLGHAAGDREIARIGKILERTVRGMDTVARLGGDEFLVLAPETGQSGAAQLVDRLSQALQAASVSASIGWAVRKPSETLNDTFTRADRHMYDIKAAGRPGR